jgi:hypothetical protein
VNLGEVVKRAEDMVNYAAEDRVAGRNGDNPLVELDLVVDVWLGAAVKLIKLNINNKVSLVVEFGRNLFINRF